MASAPFPLLVSIRLASLRDTVPIKGIATAPVGPNTPSPITPPAPAPKAEDRLELENPNCPASLAAPSTLPVRITLSIASISALLKKALFLSLPRIFLNSLARPGSSPPEERFALSKAPLTSWDLLPLPHMALALCILRNDFTDTGFPSTRLNNPMSTLLIKSSIPLTMIFPSLAVCGSALILAPIATSRPRSKSLNLTSFPTNSFSVFMAWLAFAVSGLAPLALIFSARSLTRETNGF